MRRAVNHYIRRTLVNDRIRFTVKIKVTCNQDQRRRVVSNGNIILIDNVFCGALDVRHRQVVIVNVMNNEINPKATIDKR